MPVRRTVSLLVVLDEALLDALDGHESARHRAVDERRVRAPAEGVRVAVRIRSKDAAFLLQSLNDLLGPTLP